jgi:hypothetical protein
MSIEAACYSILSLDATLLAAHGGRVYLQQRLIGTVLPALTFEVPRNDPVRVLGGASNLMNAEVVVTAVADTYSAARSLADAVRAEFEGAHAAAGMTLESVRFTNEAPLEAVFDLGDENEPTRIEQTFSIHYRYGA